MVTKRKALSDHMKRSSRFLGRGVGGLWQDTVHVRYTQKPSGDGSDSALSKAQ